MEELRSTKQNRRRTARINAGDRVVLMQVWLSVAVLVFILMLLYLMPSAYAKLSEQYVRFVTGPQLFDPAAAGLAAPLDALLGYA